MTRTPPVDTPTAASPQPPALSLLFGFGPALILAALGAAAWLLPAEWRPLALVGGVLWGAAILLFIAGVRRGLSFFTRDGPQPVQVAGAIWLFGFGLATLVLPPPWSFLPLALGYLDVAVIDPYLARHGEAPRHFAALRPAQAVIFLIGVALLAAYALTR
jgi:hypothetical protein